MFFFLLNTWKYFVGKVILTLVLLCLHLLSHVRLPLISLDFLMTTVDTEVLVRDSAECKELLLEAMKYHLLPEQRSLLISERTCYRRPEGIEHYVFAIGNDKLNYIHLFY